MPSIEAVANQALDLIGYKRHIGNINDGTMAARVLLNTWGESRDEALIMQEWDFARAFPFLSTAGVAAPTPWTFEYLYPGDCVKVLMLKPSAIPDDPQPVRWQEIYDTRLLFPFRAIVSTTVADTAVITRRVLDPNSWPADFTGVVIQILAKKLASGLAQEERHADSRGRSKSGPRDSGEQA